MTNSPTFHDVLSNALAYWEKRRLLYNAVLVGIALLMFLVGQSETRSLLSVSGAVVFLMLAVAANLLYTVAYLPDIALQLSAYRESWLRWRKGLFWFGLVFAALLTVWVMGVGIVSLWLSSSS
jgi:Mn2+/Fe2+ NRAMP family transporter